MSSHPMDMASRPNLVAEPGSDGIFVEFFEEQEFRAFKSREAGVPIYEPVEKVRIIIAGDKNASPVHEVSDYHREKYPIVYSRFKQGLKGREQITGFLLTAWPMMPSSVAMHLNANEVWTVEQLGALTDTAIQSIGMGTRVWVEKAKEYLIVAKDDAKVAGIVAENAVQKSDIEALKRQLADMSRLMAEKFPQAIPAEPVLVEQSRSFDEVNVEPARPSATRARPSRSPKDAFLAGIEHEA